MGKQLFPSGTCLGLQRVYVNKRTTTVEIYNDSSQIEIASSTSLYHLYHHKTLLKVYVE